MQEEFAWNAAIAENSRREKNLQIPPLQKQDYVLLYYC